MVRKGLTQERRRRAFGRVYLLQTEEYGVPQRRTRVVLVGDASGELKVEPPSEVTQLNGNMSLFSEITASVTTSEALSDLPALEPGEDGKHKTYVHEATHPYQEFMRSLIGPEEYLQALHARI